ncbi:hypothetical protein [Mycobacterium intracellulare]|uniref:hypothetical protein n=1 Tax=Mycobacterium intracellulare TaxID=1767 RepID=UPI000CE49A1D|nr:hypothetical protein [Mycobacterium intracellulare]
MTTNTHPITAYAYAIADADESDPDPIIDDAFPSLTDITTALTNVLGVPVQSSYLYMDDDMNATVWAINGPDGQRIASLYVELPAK